MSNKQGYTTLEEQTTPLGKMTHTTTTPTSLEYSLALASELTNLLEDLPNDSLQYQKQDKLQLLKSIDIPVDAVVFILSESNLESTLKTTSVAAFCFVNITQHSISKT